MGGIEGLVDILGEFKDLIKEQILAKDYFETCPEERHCVLYEYKSDYHNLSGLELLEFFFFCVTSGMDVYSHYDTLGGVTGLHISRDSCL